MMPDHDAKQARVTRAFRAITQACVNAGLTTDETIIVAAQFTGMTIATSPHIAAHDAQMKVAGDAMRNAHDQYLARRIMV